MRVGLIDYGAGNLTSVRNAFEFIDALPIMVRQPADFFDRGFNVRRPQLLGVGSEEKHQPCVTASTASIPR